MRGPDRLSGLLAAGLIIGVWYFGCAEKVPPKPRLDLLDPCAGRMDTTFAGFCNPDTVK